MTRPICNVKVTVRDVSVCSSPQLYGVFSHFFSSLLWFIALINLVSSQLKHEPSMPEKNIAHTVQHQNWTSMLWCNNFYLEFSSDLIMLLSTFQQKFARF